MPVCPRSASKQTIMLMIESCPPPPVALAAALSICVCVGVVVSYIPQIARILWARSSEGFSAFFLVLGGSSSSLSFLNALVLHFPVRNCSFLLHIGLLQVGLQWAMFTTLCAMFIAFFPDRQTYDYRQALGVLSITAALCVSIAIITAIFLGQFDPYSHTLQAWNTFLGLASAGLSAAQYLPQIYHTLKVQRPASLSIPMMCIQAPGSFVFVLALALQPAVDWTTCLAFLVTGCLQSALLVICVSLRASLRKRGLDEYARVIPNSHSSSPQESDPLIA